MNFCCPYQYFEKTVYWLIYLDTNSFGNLHFGDLRTLTKVFTEWDILLLKNVLCGVKNLQLLH